MRMESGLTQEDIAELIGTKKPNISRLESPSGRHSPRLTTIRKYAEATGYEMQIRFKRISTSKKVRGSPQKRRARV
jgi:transcriptional regulator with XRE-family HTH domain